MTTSAEPSTGLARTLVTIPNRQRWQGWSKTGVQSKSLVITHSIYALLELSSRCTAPAEDLDGSIYPSRSKEHTELISAEFELGQLWDEYGLVGDIVVGVHTIIPHFKLIYCLAIYE